ncbi:hypothetical protein [Herbaspirillum frisingense]|uniref:hypothetical protein n=1 Tax=Herbaspirillum frisingense TaxID=92645 RepID=UPI001F3B6C8D|nr:hypothetical protein [Herbaspirillum frisingense]UIN20797.1 hypothetical protein LAZ82_20360 [Herbaspirillum frisingense]
MAFVLCALAGGSAAAQQLIKVDDVSSVAQIGRDVDGFTSCGIRTVGLAISATESSAFDFSILFRADVVGALGKFGGGTFKNTELIKKRQIPDFKPPAPDTFWIAASEDDLTAAPINKLQSQTPGFLLVTLSPVKAISIIRAISSGQNMQVSLKWEGRQYHPVYQFSAPLPPDEQRSLSVCISSSIEKLKAEAQRSGKDQ